ncbi:hypothetical protein HBI56_054790 [Parastagonospora nodorum]|nr:hypothetical protein HBH53_147760 [Parastagonospora nodorum]KAH3967012.1 hypothetical protein HBH51_139170 [Parastagonospora nodorum]KAH4927788.1 hypothetical protein HBH74_109050 [Parastagonospora nodorum]KAH4965756.1 hypothetical protein HBH73_063940 [Parastagonospora nodorum]KAH5186975.1 hypothetical protein HBH76_117790 [Parastagonospora nodorum]
MVLMSEITNANLTLLLPSPRCLVIDTNLVSNRSSETVRASSSFTAINQSQPACVATQSTSPAQPSQGRASSSTRRRRNPTVAQYLGLGSSDEPAHLEKYAPLPNGPRSPPPKPAKRRRKPRGTDDAVHATDNQSSAVRQRHISEGLKITKSSAFQTPLKASRNIQASEQCKSTASKSVAAEVSLSDITWAHVGPTCTNIANTTRTSRDVTHKSHPIDSDFTLEDIPDNAFDDDDLDDEEFLKLASNMIDTGGSVHDRSSSPLKSDVAQYEIPPAFPSTATNSKEDDDRRRTKKKFVSPMTLTTRLLALNGDIDCAEARKPIARAPFPNAVCDRSPIIGLSPNTLLRTCFRIGEAINQAHQSSRSDKRIVFELYARILDSERVETKQLFTLCDLFHGKPPYIKASYEGVLWKSVQLYDYDSKRLLLQGRICRCMGTMKRDGKEWVMSVMNIWEATWDDIKWVEGIINF